MSVVLPREVRDYLTARYKERNGHLYRPTPLYSYEGGQLTRQFTTEPPNHQPPSSSSSSTNMIVLDNHPAETSAAAAAGAKKPTPSEPCPFCGEHLRNLMPHLEKAHPFVGFDPLEPDWVGMGGPILPGEKHVCPVPECGKHLRWEVMPYHAITRHGVTADNITSSPFPLWVNALVGVVSKEPVNARGSGSGRAKNTTTKRTTTAPTVAAADPLQAAEPEFSLPEPPIRYTAVPIPGPSEAPSDAAAEARGKPARRRKPRAKGAVDTPALPDGVPANGSGSRPAGPASPIAGGNSGDDAQCARAVPKSRKSRGKMPAAESGPVEPTAGVRKPDSAKGKKAGKVPVDRSLRVLQWLKANFPYPDPTTGSMEFKVPPNMVKPLGLAPLVGALTMLGDEQEFVRMPYVHVTEDSVQLYYPSVRDPPCTMSN